LGHRAVHVHLIVGNPRGHWWSTALVYIAVWVEESGIIAIIEARLSMEAAIRVARILCAWRTILRWRDMPVSSLTVCPERHLCDCTGCRRNHKSLGSGSRGIAGSLDQWINGNGQSNALWLEAKCCVVNIECWLVESAACAALLGIVDCDPSAPPSPGSLQRASRKNFSGSSQQLGRGVEW
jgi:hypothetical protein